MIIALFFMHLHITERWGVGVVGVIGVVGVFGVVVGVVRVARVANDGQLCQLPVVVVTTPFFWFLPLNYT